MPKHSSFGELILLRVLLLIFAAIHILSIILVYKQMLTCPIFGVQK